MLKNSGSGGRILLPFLMAIFLSGAYPAAAQEVTPSMPALPVPPVVDALSASTLTATPATVTPPKEGGEELVLQLAINDDQMQDFVEGLQKNGKTYLLPCLESHWPLDAVILALGVNDLKARFGVGPSDIAASVGVLIDAVKNAAVFNGKPPKILVLAAAPILETGWLGEMFAGGAEKSLTLAKHLEAVSASRQVTFLNIGAVAHVSPLDGIHFDATQHQAIGLAVAHQLKAIIA